MMVLLQGCKRIKFQRQEAHTYKILTSKFLYHTMSKFEAVKIFLIPNYTLILFNLTRAIIFMLSLFFGRRSLNFVFKH